MVVPYKEATDLDDLTDEELLDLMKLVRRCQNALVQVMKPDGFNIGLNLGKGRGAGILGHLHIHIVPRWQGDTNFMPVLANTSSCRKPCASWPPNSAPPSLNPDPATLLNPLTPLATAHHVSRFTFHVLRFTPHRHRVAMPTETLHFENARVAQQLYNNDPRNLQALEHQLGVKATSREGWIKLEGEVDAMDRVKTAFSAAGELFAGRHAGAEPGVFRMR